MEAYVDDMLVKRLNEKDHVKYLRRSLSNTTKVQNGKEKLQQIPIH